MSSPIVTLTKKGRSLSECRKSDKAVVKTNMKPPQPQTPRTNTKRRLPCVRVFAHRSRAFGDIVVSRVHSPLPLGDDIISPIIYVSFKTDVLLGIINEQ
jgi:hypothetical protein